METHHETSCNNDHTNNNNHFKPIQIDRPISLCDHHYCSFKENPQSTSLKNNQKFLLLKEFYHRQRYRCSLRSSIIGFIPILKWLPSYKFKTDFIADLIAGLTVLALNIPQGLAYGHLAGAEPIQGLYVSVFPVILYALFGTSNHVSIGTFSIVSIACKDVLESIQLDQEVIAKSWSGSRLNETIPFPENSNINPADILISLCLLVGIIQFCLGMLRLGVLSILLSDALVSGFLVASSIHVFTTQIFDFTGVESTKGDDYEIPLPMDIINAYIRFFTRIPKTNIPTLILSIICFALLIGCKFWLQPKLKNKFKISIPIPIDIMLIIISLIMSAVMDFNGRFGIHIIPEIPKAFDHIPKVPGTSLMLRMIPGAILICIISYILSYSLGTMYAKQYGYKINPNQELIALGVANTISSFFQCYPCCASLSRSAVQERVGGRTQLVSLIAGTLMVFVLLFFSTHFHYLPKCVLSSIICVAILNTILQFPIEMKKAWHSSPIDGVLWIITFIFVVLFGIGHGLLYSTLLSFALLILKLITSKMKLKYRLDETELFIEIQDGQFQFDREKFFHCLKMVKISKTNQQWIVFEFQGPLIFINALYFRTRFYSMIGRFIVELAEREHNSTKANNRTVIMDCSRLSFIDAKGTEALLETQSLLQKYSAHIVLAACSESVYKNLEKFKFFEIFNKSHCYLSSIDNSNIVQCIIRPGYRLDLSQDPNIVKYFEESFVKYIDNV